MENRLNLDEAAQVFGIPRAHVLAFCEQLQGLTINGETAINGENKDLLFYELPNFSIYESYNEMTGAYIANIRFYMGIVEERDGENCFTEYLADSRATYQGRNTEGILTYKAELKGINEEFAAFVFEEAKEIGIMVRQIFLKNYL